MQAVKQQAQTALIPFERGNALHRERFGALNREWLTRYFYVEPQDKAMFADPESIVLAPGGAILFAVAEAGIVGTGGLLPMQDGEYEIIRMAVTEAYQARGIGRRLFLALLEEARKRKARKVFIVSSTLMENAIRLYRRHGFIDSSEAHHTHYARGDITLEFSLSD